LATVPGKDYFAILRLFSPTEAAINKNWKLGDIERLGEPCRRPTRPAVCNCTTFSPSAGESLSV
jgi:hypothetical protein